MIFIAGRTEREGARFHHTPQNGAQHKIYELLSLGIFHLIFPDWGWEWVTETMAVCLLAQSLCRVWLSETPRTAAWVCQAPPTMWLSRQEYWSGLPFPSPRDLPDPGIESTSPEASALAGGFFTTESPGKPETVAMGGGGLLQRTAPLPQCRKLEIELSRSSSRLNLFSSRLLLPAVSSVIEVYHRQRPWGAKWTVLQWELCCHCWNNDSSPLPTPLHCFSLWHSPSPISGVCFLPCLSWSKHYLWTGTNHPDPCFLSSRAPGKNQSHTHLLSEWVNDPIFYAWSLIKVQFNSLGASHFPSFILKI